MRSLLPVVMLALFSQAALAFDFIRFQPPSALTEPKVSRSALGATYDYRGQGEFAGTELQITVARVPPEILGTRHDSPAGCLDMFLEALRGRAPDLFVAPSRSSLLAGGLDLPEVRWTHRRGAGLNTGVLACTVHKQHFVVINFGAPSKGALTRLSQLRLALAGLTLNF